MAALDLGVADKFGTEIQECILLSSEMLKYGPPAKTPDGPDRQITAAAG
jgi:hypothetical protein